MSAVPSDVSFGERPERSPSGNARLSIAATAYLIAIAILAGLLAAPFVPRLQTENYSARVWVTFLLFATGAALAQVALVKIGRNQSYHATNVFLIPAILLLPPELVVVVAVVQHIPAWLKNRTAWYRECFNICNYVIASIAAWAAVQADPPCRRPRLEHGLPARRRGPRLLGRARRPEPRDARADAAARPRAHDP